MPDDPARGGPRTEGPRRSGPDPLPDLSAATREQPLVILVSACLLGHRVGYDGGAYPSDPVAALCALPTVRALPFCPEAHTLPVPRRWMTIHGGDGFAVLDGRAQVVDVDGLDLSAAFRAGAEALLELGRTEGAALAILTDVSPSCGSTVIIDGDALPERRYLPSSGVATALLRDAGIPVISQRDHRSLSLLRAALDPGFLADPDARDHHEGEWYRSTFGPAPSAAVPEGDSASPEPTVQWIEP